LGPFCGSEIWVLRFQYRIERPESGRGKGAAVK